jgi:hypothetical protein
MRPLELRSVQATILSFSANPLGDSASRWAASLLAVFYSPTAFDNPFVKVSAGLCARSTDAKL